MHESLPALEIAAQFPAPEPVPQSLAYDGKPLWTNAREAGRVVALSLPQMSP